MNKSLKSFFVNLSALLLASAVRDDIGIDGFMGSTSDEGIVDLDPTFYNEPLVVSSGKIPSWLNGEYFVMGPHKLQVGATRVSHLLDGLGILYKFSLNASRQSASWSANPLEGDLFQASEKAGEMGSTVLFRETEPPRQKTNSITNLFAIQDNDYVQMCEVNGDILGFTDDKYVSSFTKDTLEWSGVEFKDSLMPKTAQSSSVTHVLKEYSTGDLIGMAIVSPYVSRPYAAIYRLDGKKGSHTRIELARVPLSSTPYAHSFGLSDKHAIVCEHEWSIDTNSLLHGGMFMEASVIGQNGTKMHLVELVSGKVQTFEMEDPFVCIHFANVREIQSNGDEIVTFELPTWKTRNGSEEQCNPYGVFDFFRISDQQMRDDFKLHCDNSFMRHSLNKNSSQASSELLDDGWYEYPTYNWHARGGTVGKSCFTYLVEYYADGTGTYGSMGLAKFDSCTMQKVATWNEPSTFPSEPHYIARDPSYPYTAAEDDGVILTTVMNGASSNRLSELLVLSAKELSVLARIPLDRPVPATVHGWWVVS